MTHKLGCWNVYDSINQSTSTKPGRTNLRHIYIRPYVPGVLVDALFLSRRRILLARPDWAPRDAPGSRQTQPSNDVKGYKDPAVVLPFSRSAVISHVYDNMKKPNSPQKALLSHHRTLPVRLLPRACPDFASRETTPALFSLVTLCRLDVQDVLFWEGLEIWHCPLWNLGDVHFGLDLKFGGDLAGFPFGELGECPPQALAGSVGRPGQTLAEASRRRTRGHVGI